MRRTLCGALLSGSALALYLALLRKRVLRWGATAAEAAGTLPGDELLEHPDGQATRAIEIDAPATSVWPWLVQMGPSPRGGAYTYDWIESLMGLDMHSVEAVIPEFQNPQVGEMIGSGPNRMRLERLEPERALCWRSQNENWVWSFVLLEHGGRTRLISRNRFRLPTARARIGMLAMEPASLLMERKMLIGIRERAERLAASPGAHANLSGGPEADGEADGGAGRRAHVLVCYATKYGSTRGVAERITSRLSQHAINAELMRCEDVGPTAGFDAVVLGSPVLNQRWLPEAEAFVQLHQHGLASQPVWLFSVASFGESKPLIGPMMRREPRDIETLRNATNARDYRVFAGVVERDMWPLAARIFYYALGGHLGDNRRWPEIDAWADRIAGALGGLPAQPAVQPTP